MKLFGEPVESPVSESMRKKVAEISPWEFVSKDDPPTLLIYTGSSEGTPLPETASTGESIHHAAFGKALKERLDELSWCEFPSASMRIENLFIVRSERERAQGICPGGREVVRPAVRALFLEEKDML